MEQQGFYKAAVYCRLSQDDGQKGDSTSIQNQKEILGKYCTEQGFAVYDYYADDGYSGLNFDRPDFIRMLNDIDAKKVNLVITKDLSRLGRDYIQTGYYTEIYFQNKNIRYIAINDNVDTLRNDNDIAPFKNILNDMYARDLSRKIKAVKRHESQQGKYSCGHAPYGYVIDPNKKGKFIIDEEAAEVVRLIFSLALSGKGVYTIRNELERRQILTPTEYLAKKGINRYANMLRNEKRKGEFDWKQETVANILHRRMYVGDMVSHMVEVKNYKTKKRTYVPKEQHIIVENTHEPIISREDFERVQSLIAARHKPRLDPHPNIFKSVMYCKCGHRLTIYRFKRRKGTHKSIVEYRCQKHYSNPQICPKHTAINYDKLYEIISDRLKAEFKKWQDSDGAYDELFKLMPKTDNAQVVMEKSAAEKRLGVLGRTIRKLYDDYANDLLSAENYHKILSESQKEQETLNKRLIELNAELSKEVDLAANFKKLKATADRFVDFDELTTDMLCQVIERIEVKPKVRQDGFFTQEIDIIYRFIGQSVS